MNLRDVPIQRKLRFVILATCTAALCVASAALFALQYFFFQRDYKRDLESLAEIVSSIAAPAISRGGEDTTQAVLKALHAKPHIIGASIILNDGRTVAQIGKVEQKLQEFPTAADGFHTVSGHLIYVHPISDDTQRVGTLYLVSDYRKRSIHLHALYASIVRRSPGTLVSHRRHHFVTFRAGHLRAYSKARRHCTAHRFEVGLFAPGREGSE